MLYLCEDLKHNVADYIDVNNASQIIDNNKGYEFIMKYLKYEFWDYCSVINQINDDVWFIPKIKYYSDSQNESEYNETKKYGHTVFKNMYDYSELFFSNNSDKHKIFVLNLLKIKKGSLYQKERIFRTICKNENLIIVKYLHKIMNFKKREFMIDHNELLRLSSFHGKIKIVKYLHKIGFDKSDFKILDDFILRYVCKNGHTKIAKFLCKKIGFTSEDFRGTYANSCSQMYNNGLLEFAFANDNIKMFKFLRKKMSLTTYDFSNKSNNFFQKACIQGCFKLIKYVCRHFNLDRKIITMNLQFICSYGHTNILKYVHKKFNITHNDIVFNQENILVNSCLRNKYEILKYIFQNIGSQYDKLTHERMLYFAQRNENVQLIDLLSEL